MSKRAVTNIQVMRDEFKRQLGTYYQNLAVSVIDWSGWPDQEMRIPRRQPEKQLYETGCFTIFKLEETGEFYCLPVASMNLEKNVYGEPSQWRAMALGTLASVVGEKRLDPSNAVLVRNNDTYTPSKPYVELMVEQLANVEFTLRMNVNAQKMPFRFKSNMQNVLSNKNVFMAMMECEPVIFQDDSASVEGPEPMDWDIPCKMADLNDCYNVYDQRICEYLGLDCVGRDKKERLTAEEADANAEKIEAIRTVKLEQRKLAVDLAKELWPDEMDSLKVELAVKPKEDETMITEPEGEE